MPRTAMIVDDMPFVRHMIREILTSENYVVIAEAANGVEAIALYQQYKPDFVTMDVVMPEKTGIEATRNILSVDPDAKIIMVSAMSHEQLLMEAVQAGAKDYILKPFTKQDLLESIEKILKEDDNPAQQRRTVYGS